MPCHGSGCWWSASHCGVWVQSQASSCRSCGRLPWQEVFLWGPHFSPVSIIPPVFYTHQHQTLLRTGSILTKWFKGNNSSHVEITWIIFVSFYLCKWRHKTTQRHNTTVSKQLGNLCDSSNIFFSVLLWEAQIFIEASSDIISIQSICRNATWNQESF